MDSIKDVEVANQSSNTTPLLDQPTKNKWKLPLKGLLIFSGVVLVLCISVAIIFNNYNYRSDVDDAQNLKELETDQDSIILEVVALEESDSEKEYRLLNDPGALSPSSYQWTNKMLSSHKTGFHFRPHKYWQSDPSGPMYYKGWYHFFYQHNPEAAVWGNIVWGHAVSRDLINWFYLPHALVPDHWYDIGGCFTGCATMLQDGSIVMLYTGATKDKVQIINQASPANLSDPLLIDWVKSTGNPILVQPPGIGLTEFRDPSTAWLTSTGSWRFTIGTKNNHTGISLMYETKDFTKYTLLDERLHEVPHTGMWECVDLYPVSLTGMNGLDTSVYGPQVKHVLKASIDEQQRDYYAVGSYDLQKDVWTPDDPNVDVGIELRYDYGRFYASRTFYDQKKQRRVLWGYIRETDSEDSDRKRGWACLQCIPREITLDNKTNANVLQWPVKELENLRSNKKVFSQVKLGAGSVVPLDVGKTTQLDITAEFEIDKNALEGVEGGDVRYNCTTSQGASVRSALGPFGLLVLANDDRSEQTAIYFYIAKGTDGNLKTFFCTDQSRSTKATDVRKENYGSKVRVLDDEKLSVRILVDHSMVEAFAQGGRTVITSRIYPTEAIEGAARVFLFNNATGIDVTATSVKIWEMDSASLKFYPGVNF